MAKWIVGIHGLANKPPRDTLRSWWYDSLREGLVHNRRVADPTFNFDMVYWADLLYKNPLHQDDAFQFDALYNKEPYYPAKPAELKLYRDRWIDRVRSEATEIGGRGLEAVKETLGVHRIADALLERVLKDLAYYWGDPPVQLRGRDGKMASARAVLDRECRDALVKHVDDEIMLIAHSMGTIISFNVLRALGRPDAGVRVPYYVTIGSPLGLAHVKDRIRRDHAEVRTPTIVTERWVNLADRKDPVAFDLHLRDDFVANDLGVRVVDDLVLNDYHRGTNENHHKSYGYLRTPEMSNLVAEFLDL